MTRKGSPPPGERPSAQAGTRMLALPACTADPIRLAEDSIEQLQREHPTRLVKTRKRKPKRSGAIGAPRR